VLARRTRAGFLRWGPLRSVLLSLMRDHGAVGTLGIAVVDDDEIRRVHLEFLDEDCPTDVISFRLDEGPPGKPDDTLGEVVISAETAAREAARRGLRPDLEIALYAIHGALHLVGFDDSIPAERRRMRRWERAYLSRYEVLASRRFPRGGGRAVRRLSGGGTRSGEDFANS